MSITCYRTLSFAGNQVTVGFTGRSAKKIGDFLFNAYPTGNYHQTIDYRLTQEDEALTLWSGDKSICESNDKAFVAEILQAKVTRDLVAGSRGGLVFHAACVSNGDKSVLLPAPSGWGKTTLSAWLACQGYNCLADDVVFVPLGGQSLVPLTRPLQLKGESRKALQPYFNWRDHIDQVLFNDQFCLLPSHMFGHGQKIGNPRLALLIFPQYKPNNPTELTTLSPSQTGLALMESLVNARNLEGHGLSEIVYLCRIIPAFRLVYSGFEQLQPRLIDLLCNHLN